MTYEELERLFKVDMPEVLEKYTRFKEKKDVEGDTLMRWCVKAGCKGFVRAENAQVIKLVCPECQTALCFQCRDEYHGETQSCEEAMEQRYEGWAKDQA